MWPFKQKPPPNEAPQPWWDGVARSFDDIHPEAWMNRPNGSDFCNQLSIDDHFRACYALIAQLHERVKALEGAQRMKGRA